MSLVILGQSGGPTQLSADDNAFGLMTQLPDGAVRHTVGGLTSVDGGTAFGVPFKLVAYLSKTATGTTSVNLCSANCPYKLRVLKVKVRVVDDAKGRARTPFGSVSVVVRQGTTGAPIAAVNFTELRSNEEKEVPAAPAADSAIVAADGSLQVYFNAVLPVQKASTTYTAVCELECVRVL